MNYFVNFMLKYFPDELTGEMLQRQEEYLDLLKGGKSISLSYVILKMTSGRIRFVDCSE